MSMHLVSIWADGIFLTELLLPVVPQMSEQLRVIRHPTNGDGELPKNYFFLVRHVEHIVRHMEYHKTYLSVEFLDNEGYIEAEWR